MSMSSQAKELSAEMRISEPSLLAIKKASLALPALSGLVLCCLLTCFTICDGNGHITTRDV